MSRPCKPTFPLAINSAREDLFGMLVVKNFDGIAVEDGDNGAVKAAKARPVRQSKVLNNAAQNQMGGSPSKRKDHRMK